MALTQKQVKEMYQGKKFGDKYPETITTIVFDRKYAARGLYVAILLSGRYEAEWSGYDVEAIIDMETGENLIPGRCRPCYSRDDALNVASEMLYC